MNRADRIIYFKNICDKLKNKSNEDIEESLIEYIKLKKNQLTIESCKNSEIINVFLDNDFPLDIELLIEFYEYLLDKDAKNENGIVFTPKYISDYIVEDSLNNIKSWNKKIKIIDPGCGCGIFLISAIEYLHNKFNVEVRKIIENNIYGIDIVEDNIRRCNFVMELYCIINNEYYKKLKCNLKCADSLKENWNELFKIEKFDYIIGNPPYVNAHDMKKDTNKFLKETFETTKGGMFNIFYAFIENGMNYIDESGSLEFIIPNNFLTIKSAVNLRKLLQNNKWINKIIDFSNNMLFRPVRTYNCILKLDKIQNESFTYTILKKCDDEDIEKKLTQIKFNEKNYSELDSMGWKLVDRKTLKNIYSIENQKTPLKDFIRTGIATLKDKVYIVDKDEKGYFKNVNDKRFDIDNELVKPIYKIPELKKCDNSDDALQYIIFPYEKMNGVYKLIAEDVLKEKYEETYKYLCEMKETLNKRDKGKGNPYGWYAYGRTQGLNKYGKKMVFPTFASKPKFKYIDNEDALFCNGYAVFENNTISLDILEKILNSKIMQYYVSNTSYPIEGGYYCYQKKYIEKFSIPEFDENEITILKGNNIADIDDMLIKKYNIYI